MQHSYQWRYWHQYLRLYPWIYLNCEKLESGKIFIIYFRWKILIITFFLKKGDLYRLRQHRNSVWALSMGFCLWNYSVSSDCIKYIRYGGTTKIHPSGKKQLWLRWLLICETDRRILVGSIILSFECKSHVSNYNNNVMIHY